jgi:hypothetical protein
MKLETVMGLSLIGTAITIMIWTYSLINAFNGYGFVITAYTNVYGEFWFEYIGFIIILGIQFYAILKK